MKKSKEAKERGRAQLTPSKTERRESEKKDKMNVR